MSKITVFVGLDYHQASVQVCVVDVLGKVLLNRSCENDATVICGAVERHGQPQSVAIEACCGAADLADELITQAGWSVTLCHAGVVARMKTNPDKSDYGDARLLADLARVGYLPRVWLPPERTRQLRQLVRYRMQLVAERQRHKQQVSALLRQERLGRCEGTSWTKKWLTWLRRLAWPRLSQLVVEQHAEQVTELTRRIGHVEQLLEAELQGDPAAQWLRTQPGIGLVTAAMLCAEIGDVQRFANGKQLARFCGLSPQNASSGTRQADAGVTHAGNPALKRVLVEAAHRLAHRDARWGGLAARLKQAGKPTCVAISAVANRWVRQLYYGWREQLKTV